MNKLPKGLMIKLPNKNALMSVRDGTAYYKIVYKGIDLTEYFNKEAELHREGGKPAIIYSSGKRRYFIDGEEVPSPNELKDLLEASKQDLAYAKRVVEVAQQKYDKSKIKKEA